MMTNPVRIFFGPQLAKDLKRLRKKYLSIRHDVSSFVERLQIGELPGDQVRGTGFTVYKARLKSSDLTKGKSSDYRVIYFIQTPTELALITIYIKSERTDLSADSNPNDSDANMNVDIVSAYDEFLEYLARKASQEEILAFKASDEAQRQLNLSKCCNSIGWYLD